MSFASWPGAARRFFVLLVFVAACVPTSRAAEAEGASLTISPVNYPLAAFAQRITGGDATVVLPVPVGVAPAFLRPDADAVADFQRADRILLNGFDRVPTGRARTIFWA